MKYISKYLEPSKNNFLILKNLSSILEFWKDVPLILENFRNEFKLKELQPILYYLILSSKFKYLNYTLFEKNQKYFENTLLEKNINDQSFIDFYIKNTNLFKKFDENNSSGVESNVIVIKNEGFDIGNVNPLESTEKIYFKLNSKKASLVLLMLDHIEV